MPTINLYKYCPSFNDIILNDIDPHLHSFKYLLLFVLFSEIFIYIFIVFFRGFAFVDITPRQKPRPWSLLLTMTSHKVRAEKSNVRTHAHLKWKRDFRARREQDLIKVSVHVYFNQMILFSNLIQHDVDHLRGTRRKIRLFAHVIYLLLRTLSIYIHLFLPSTIIVCSIWMCPIKKKLNCLN